MVEIIPKRIAERNQAMFQNNFLRTASAALLLFLICIIGGAQEFRGSITGKVTDSNGAIIPGATVTLKNVETNIQATTNTNDEGSYEFRLLLPGKYTLTEALFGVVTTQRNNPRDIQLGVKFVF